MMQGVRLTVSGVHLPEDQDPLGIWELDGRKNVAFAANAALDGLAWQVDLPELTQDAHTHLRIQHQQVAARARHLDTIAARVMGLDLTLRYEAQVGVHEALGVHEAALVNAVTALRSQITAFDVGAGARVDYRELYARCEALVSQFRALVRPVGRVETVIEGRLIALTAVDWNADYRTAWLNQVTLEEMELHLDAVRLAMASRQALLRLCVVVVTGALNLALRAHIPGGQILLLPAVYQFVRDVLQELERLPDGGSVR